MLEIIFLVILCRKIGEKATAKGRGSGRYKALLVGMWFVGEFLGLIAGIVMNGGEVGAPAYIIGILGAIAGVIVTFVIVGSLSPVGAEYSYPAAFPVTPLPPGGPDVPLD